MSDQPDRFLTDFRLDHPFLVAVDSDGSALDTMEIKYQECFIPKIIGHFGLQAVSRYVRQTAEFVHLRSKWRGLNRFPALALIFDLLERRPEVRARGVSVPRLPHYRRWLSGATEHSNSSLRAAIQTADAEADELERVLNWSEAVDAAIAEMVHSPPAFPFVRESLASAARSADVVVVSSAPRETLVREWNEQGLAQFTDGIAGQEMGFKARILQAVTGGRYVGGRGLMIGDALGDLDAAHQNGLLFYPINPGREAESWERLHREALDLFFAGRYDAGYEAQLIREFQTLLPVAPPWEANSFAKS